MDRLRAGIVWARTAKLWSVVATSPADPKRRNADVFPAVVHVAFGAAQDGFVFERRWRRIGVAGSTCSSRQQECRDGAAGRPLAKDAEHDRGPWPSNAAGGGRALDRRHWSPSHSSAPATVRRCAADASQRVGRSPWSRKGRCDRGGRRKFVWQRAPTRSVEHDVDRNVQVEKDCQTSPRSRTDACGAPAFRRCLSGSGPGAQFVPECFRTRGCT